MEYYIKMFKNNQVFSVRKSRKFRNLCGAIIAGAVLVVLGVGSASADEVATPANTNTANTTQVSPVNTTEKVEVSKDATFNTEVPTTAKLNEAVSNAKNAGVTVNETSATTVDSDKTAHSDYDKQAVAIDKATQDYQKATEAYNKEVEAYNKATDVATEGKGESQTTQDQGQYKTWQKVTVNNDGTFTSTHDLNDGVSSFAQGTLSGKINYTVSNNGDGSEKITVSTVDLNSYNLNVTGPNTAVNKDIRYVAKSPDGTEWFAWSHNGLESKDNAINKSFALNQTFNVKAGEYTPWVNFLKIDDTWIEDTFGQLYFRIQNKNTAPTAPAVASVSWHKDNVKKPISVSKQVVDADGKDINNGTVQVGQEIAYVLNGARIENQSAEAIKKWKLIDYLDGKHDEYLGWEPIADSLKGVKYANGSAVTVDDIVKNANVTYNAENHKWELDLPQTFFAKLDRKSAFDLDVKLKAKRIASGDAYNDVVQVVNDKTVISKTVVTHTPEKPKPVTPTGEKTPTTPVVYTPEAPKPANQAPALPKTGDAETGLTVIAGMLMAFSAVGIAGAKRKED